MSLINEALKKAQSQRTNPPGAPPTGTIPPIAVSGNSGDASKPTPFGKAGVLIALCAVIVSLSVVTTVFLLRGNSNASANASNSRTDLKPGETITPMVVSPRTATNSVNPGTLPANANANPGEGTIGVKTVAPAATVGIPGIAPNPASVASPVVVATPVPTLAPEPTPVKVTVRIQAMVDKFRISGMRLSDTDSKVILNDHLFRVDDPVESSIGLRLTKIEEHRLTFIDADGNVYVKRL